tara:strand:- start:82 stop:264 length:183 start_codon:yes stop_codon:yes gene_type:complete
MKSIKIGKQEWNKIVRLCLVKCTDGKGSYTYKIEETDFGETWGDSSWMRVFKNDGSNFLV